MRHWMAAGAIGSRRNLAHVAANGRRLMLLIGAANGAADEHTT
jgi:hypothetical protein